MSANIDPNPTRILWTGTQPLIQTLRLQLKPIQDDDLKFYQDLFANMTAMKHYLIPRTPEQIEKRFKIWQDRWNTHSFSAMKISDKNSADIGHVILGHGDYESLDRGWSEMAIVIHPQYWNSNFKDKDQEIGLKGLQGVGTEITQAVVDYAKHLFEIKF